MIKLLLPKGVVETVAAKMVGVTRDKAGLRLCVNTMKQIVKPDKMSMPDRMRLDCIIYGSAMAFVLTLKEEICVFNELCSPFYKRLYTSLSNAMSLQDFLFSWCPCGSSGFNATVEEYEATRASVPGRTFDAAKAWPNGLPGYESARPLKELRRGASIKDGDRTPADPKPQFHPICTTFSNYIPVVPCSSVNNETVSLANRALMTVPEPDEESWKAVMESLDLSWCEPMACDLEKDFESWNSKFDNNKRRNHEEAWESLKNTPLTKKDFIRKQFVKRELTMKGGSEPQEFDPRSIQANSDRLNVSLGPFVAKATEQLKTAWSTDSRICYTAGMTAEEIGAWRGQFGSEDVTIIECDETRYDAHQGRYAYQLAWKLCAAMGIDNHGDAAFALTSMEHIRGWSSHGVVYNVSYTMTSGSPTTSFSNSFLNGTKTAFVLERMGFQHFKMLVHGDDSLIVIPGHLSAPAKLRLERKFAQYQHSLGFATKMKISESWSQVEYCSSLFWPTEDGYVLGPKIGKRLPKIGFSLRALKPGEVKGMLLGLQIEAGFVPVIRVYAKHQLSLMRKQAKQDYTDSRSVYKSLAVERHSCSEETAYFFLERYGVDMAEMETLMSDCLTSNLTDCVDYCTMSLFTAIDL
jgi:hypothetical protein